MIAFSVFFVDLNCQQLANLLTNFVVFRLVLHSELHKHIQRTLGQTTETAWQRHGQLVQQWVVALLTIEWLLRIVGLVFNGQLDKYT